MHTREAPTMPEWLVELIAKAAAWVWENRYEIIDLALYVFFHIGNAVALR